MSAQGNMGILATALALASSARHPLRRQPAGPRLTDSERQLRKARRAKVRRGRSHTKRLTKTRRLMARASRRINRRSAKR